MRFRIGINNRCHEVSVEEEPVELVVDGRVGLVTEGSKNNAVYHPAVDDNHSELKTKQTELPEDLFWIASGRMLQHNVHPQIMRPIYIRVNKGSLRGCPLA